MGINLGDIEKRNQRVNMNQNNNYRSYNGLNLSSTRIQTEEEKKKKKKYNIGNFVQDATYTTTDLGLNVMKGVLGGFEAIGDLTAYGVAGASDLVGANKFANFLRENAKQNATEILTKRDEEKLNKHSKLKQNGIIEGVAQGVGQMTTMLATSAALPSQLQNVKIGKLNLPTSAVVMGAGTGMSEAYNEGANNTQAALYGLTSGAIEGGTEAMFGGLGKAFNRFTGGGALDEFVSNAISSKLGQFISKKGASEITSKVAERLANAGVMSMGEGIEEVVSSVLNPIAKKIYSDKSLQEMYKDQNLLQDFVVGSLTSAIMQAPGTITETKQVNVEDVANRNLPGQSYSVQDVLDLERNQPNLPTNNYTYQKTDNVKIDSLNESMAKYFDNSQQSHDLANTISKIIQDKDYKVTFDDTITNKQGNSINAQISTNNGETEIKINPNSPRAVEFLMVHEITHAIETDSMKKLVLDYAKKNQEFNQALESLKATYGTEDVSSEVVADISGQLFGNQEFINNLSTKKPNVFKRIYNKIVELANKITGNSNEALFIRDLKQKWETAYRTSEQAKQGTVYSQEQLNYDNINPYFNVLTDELISQGKTYNDLTETDRKNFDRLLKFQNEHASDFDNAASKGLTNVKSGIYMIDDNLVKLTTTLENGTLYIDELYVEKQNKGTGTKVVNMLKNYANENGLNIEAMKELDSAKGFWDKTLNNKQYSLQEQSKDINSIINDKINRYEENGFVKTYGDNYELMEEEIFDEYSKLLNRELTDTDYDYVTNILEEYYDSDKDGYVSKELTNSNQQKTNEILDKINNSNDFIKNNKYIQEQEGFIKYNLDSDLAIKNINEALPSLNKINSFIEGLSNLTTVENVDTSKKSISTYVEISRESLNNSAVQDYLINNGYDADLLNELIKNKDVSDMVKIRLSDHNVGGRYDMINDQQIDYSGGDIDLFVNNLKDNNVKYSQQENINDLKKQMEKLSMFDPKRVELFNKIKMAEDNFTGTVEEYQEYKKSKSKKSNEDNLPIENKNNKETAIKTETVDINNIKPVKKGYTRLYRGINEEYNQNYDRTMIDNPNGYESWTDNYDLAKEYGKNVYYIDVPTKEINIKGIIDENGDRSLAYFNDKPVGINGVNGNEYMLYSDHDDFNNFTRTKINEKQYSLESKVDSQGNELSPQQQEYFKDSKVRDENGNLLVMYHGTKNDFTIFDKNKIGINYEGWAQDGKGFYFTKNKNNATEWAKSSKSNGSANVIEAYLNINNPFDSYKDYTDLKNLQQEYNIDNFYMKKGYRLIQFLQGQGIDSTEVLNKYGFDGIISGDDYIVFEPNQIKNTNNTNPTTNADIRYSKNGKSWQEYLENEFKATGTRTYTKDILPKANKNVKIQENLPVVEEKQATKVLNPTEISQLTPEDANTTPILPTINVETGKGKSSFVKNIREKTNMLTDESKNTILADTDIENYKQVTNKESLDKAFERIKEGGSSETFNWLTKNSKNATSVDVAEGWILLNQYQNQIANETDLIKKNELNQSMVQVAKKLREIGTNAGQTVQAFNIMNRLTPEGMVYYAQSELSEAYDQMVKNKSQKWIDKHRSDFELTPEETQFIMDTMEEVSGMVDSYEKKVKLAEIQKVMTDKLPPERGAGIKAWMRISMLFNPKTQVRNVAGNAVIAPINWFGDIVSSAVDKQIARKTGTRTVGAGIKGYGKGFRQGLYESYNDFRKGINTRDINGNRFEIGQGKSFNNKNIIGKSLNSVDSLLSFMLDAGDRGFYQASFTNSINNQLVLNKTTEVTQDMIDIATQEALSRTWQDNNNYTKFVLNIRNGLNKLVNVKGYGLGDVLIPFAKTPANLTKAIVDYSPAGMISAINKGITLKRSLNNGQFTPQMQHDFVQQVGKATAGTMLYILGTALAKAGITSGESDDDKDVANFLKNTLGINSYSIKIGDISFTYDWAQPLAAPLAITANIENKKNEEATLLENIISNLNTAGNILLEQSFMESINTVLNNNDGFASGLQEAILDLPARAIPTLSSQIANMIDPTVRTSFEYGKPLESMVNSLKYKIPYLTKELPASVDTLGNEIKRYGGNNNIFNVFLNPGNINEENINKTASEIYRLYKETGDMTIMPRVAPYYINQDGEKITLTSTEKAEYQKISGQLIEDNIEKLLNNKAYKKFSDEEKADVVSEIVNYSYNIAKNKVLGLELSDSYQKAQEYSKIGDVGDYYTFKSSIDDTDKDTKKQSISNFLIESNLNDKQIAFLYGNYYSSEETLDSVIKANIPMKSFIQFNNMEFNSDYDEEGKLISDSRKSKVVEYVNGLNLSIPQKAMLIRKEYSSFDEYDDQIINYINGMNYSEFEKAKLLKKFGLDYYDDYIIQTIDSQNISIAEKQKQLEDLGFTVRNGMVFK